MRNTHRMLTNEQLVTSAQCPPLTEMPLALEWLAYITNPRTKAAYAEEDPTLMCQGLRYFLY